MNVALNTDEQKNEMLARTIYLLANLRYWQKEKHSEQDYDVINAIAKWEQRVDDFLAITGANRYQSLQELMDELNDVHITIKENDATDLGKEK